MVFISLSVHSLLTVCSLSIDHLRPKPEFFCIFISFRVRFRFLNLLFIYGHIVFVVRELCLLSW